MSTRLLPHLFLVLLLAGCGSPDTPAPDADPAAPPSAEVPADTPRAVAAPAEVLRRAEQVERDLEARVREALEAAEPR